MAKKYADSDRSFGLKMTARMVTAVIAGIALLASACGGPDRSSMETPTPVAVAPSLSPVSVVEGAGATLTPVPLVTLTAREHRPPEAEDDTPAGTVHGDSKETAPASGPGLPLAQSAVADLTLGPSVDPTEVRGVSALDLFSGRSGSGVTYSAYSTREPTVEEILEAGLRLAGASPVHIALRGTASRESVRCAWRGIARTPTQRARTIRFWLGLEPGAAVPDALYVETLFTVTLDTLNPRFRETAKSNFLAIARGGLSTEYLFLACYADYAVSEHLLGSATSTLTVAYDRMGEAHSYELYLREHSDGSYGNEPPRSRGGVRELPAGYRH